MRIVENSQVDALSFWGLLLGIGLLVACSLSSGCRLLAIPGLALVFPALLFSLR